MSYRIQEPAPTLLKMLAHDVRWQILAALARSDLRVQELVAVVDKPINLVSYHLKLLRGSEIVHERRSSADGRDIYYSLDLALLYELYRRSGAQLHPGLAVGLAAQQHVDGGGPLRVLFVCTQNRARSQMAEGILRHLSGGQVMVQSAGIRPGEVHPLAVQTLGGLGIDISQQRSKHVDELHGQAFDQVITVCDQIREQCPVFPGEPVFIHWSIEDPIAAADHTPSEEEKPAIFVHTAQELATRIRFLLLSQAESGHIAMPT